MEKNIVIIWKILFVIILSLTVVSVYQQARERKEREEIAIEKFSVLLDYTEGKSDRFVNGELALIEVEAAIEQAKKVGVDVSLLEIYMPSLREKSLYLNAEKVMLDLQNYTEGKSDRFVDGELAVINVREAIRQAKKIGADVLDLEIKLALLEEIAKEKNLL